MDKNFYKQIVDFLEKEKYPEDRITIRDQKRWKTLCSKFFWKEDTLWRWKGKIKQPYKKLEYVFYTFCIRFVYVFKKFMIFIRNWSIFYINYTFLISHFL